MNTERSVHHGWPSSGGPTLTLTKLNRFHAMWCRGMLCHAAGQAKVVRVRIPPACTVLRQSNSAVRPISYISTLYEYKSARRFSLWYSSALPCSGYNTFGLDTRTSVLSIRFNSYGQGRYGTGKETTQIVVVMNRVLLQYPQTSGHRMDSDNIANTSTGSNERRLKPRCRNRLGTCIASSAIGGRSVLEVLVAVYRSMPSRQQCGRCVGL